MKLEAKLLLCVSADQATVAAWRRRKVVECRRFDNDEPGWTAFSNYLRAVRGLPVHIIVDTVDEDFRFETLPHARGSDRMEMIGRKLKQLYRGTPYYSWSLQERATGKRRDDRYLFVALTNPEVLAPWLKAIESNGLPVAGVYPLSIVSASLVERLRLRQTNLLIATKNSAGFRQTFFKDGRFRISRLTPLRESGGTADQYYADEVANTRMYLDALTVTHVDDTLTVVIVDQDDSLGGLPAAVARGRPNIRCHVLRKTEVAARLGIAPRDLEASADALHLHLLGEQTPALNLAPSGVTHGYRRHLATRLVYGASAAVLFGAVLWSGANAYQALALGDEIGTLQRQTQEYQSQYRQVTAQFPQAPTTAENLHNTVEAAQQIRAGLRTPEMLFTIVSHALDAAPKVQLNRLEWHYGDAAVDLESYAGAAATAAPAPPVSGMPSQVGVINAEVKPFNGDYRAAIEVINAFAAQLAANDKVAEVRAVQLPLNIRSDSGLSGSTATAAASSGAQFRLAIRFRPGV
jgi:hypothetical protein